MMLTMRARRPFWSKKTGCVIAMPFMNYGINRCGCVNAKTLSLKLTQRVESILGLRNAADSGLRIKFPCLRRIAARSIRPPTG